MNAAELVAGWLGDAGVAGACWVAPSAASCPEPVVCAEGAWERAFSTRDLERGGVAVAVTACRETPGAAEGCARACEAAVRAADWAGAALEGGSCAVRGVDCGRPRPLGRDGSGRWLWGLDVRLELERGLS